MTVYSERQIPNKNVAEFDACQRGGLTEELIFAGIDPGAGGAVAILRADGSLMSVFDMPVVQIKGRKRVAAQALTLLLATQRPAHAFVERVSSMPGEGQAGAFTFGYACGIIEGVMAGLAIPVTFITPQVWKKAFSLTRDKGECRRRAMQLWPAHAADFVRVRDDGRAEGAMIGLYGVQKSAFQRMVDKAVT